MNTIVSDPIVSSTGQPLPLMSTHAQNLEDVMIRRALQEVSSGFYIDIGAHDPEIDSVTKWFYDQGWRGINVEPSPCFHEKLAQSRPGDENLAVCIGGFNGEVEFSVIGETGLSTAMPETAAVAMKAVQIAGEVIRVPCWTLDTLLERVDPQTAIDFLKIDVEGSETAILVNSRFVRRPRLLVVEALAPCTLEPSWEDWDPHLLRSGFEFVWFDGLNRYYLDEAESWRKRYFGLPPCFLDNFRFQAMLKLQETSVELQNVRSESETQRLRLAETERSCQELEQTRVGQEVQLAAMSHRLVDAEQQLEQAAQRMTVLESRFAGCQQQLAAAGEELETLQKQREQFATLLIERDTAWETLRETQGRLVEEEGRRFADSLELDARRLELAAVKKKLMEHQLALTAESAALSERDAELTHLRETSHCLAERVAALENTQARLEAQCAQLLRHRDELLASKSWRWTAPVRIAARAFQR